MGADIGAQRLRRAGLLVEHLLQPFLAVQLIGGVGSLGDAVGVDEHLRAGTQLHLVLLVVRALHPGQDEVGPRPQIGKTAVLLPQQRWVVTRVDILQQPAPQIQRPQPRGDEHLRVVVLTQAVVGLGEYLRDVPPTLGQVPQQRLGAHHEQRAGYALAGHIRHQEVQVVAVRQIKVVEVAAHLLGRVHGGVDVEVLPLRIRREHRRQAGALDLPREFQFPVDALLRLLDVVLQGIHRGVDVVGQGRELLILPDIDMDAEVAVGDLGQGAVDLVDVVHDQPLDQEVDVGEQRREHHQFHEDLDGDGDIAGEHGLGDGDGGDEIESLRHPQHTVGIRVVDLGLEAGIRLYLHAGRCAADGICAAPGVAAVVADDGQVTVADDDTTGAPDVAVLHRQTDLIGDGTLELVCIVAHLDEAALRHGHTGVFPGDATVGGQGLVALDISALPIQQAQKLRRLGAGGHIKAHEVRQRALGDDAVLVHDVDAHHAVALRQGVQLVPGAVRRDLPGHGLRDAQQVVVGHIPDILLYIIQIQSQQLVGVGVGDASLQGVGKDAGDGESRDDADQQQELEHLRQLVGTLAAYDPLLTDHGHQQ